MKSPFIFVIKMNILNVKGKLDSIKHFNLIIGVILTFLTCFAQPYRDFICHSNINCEIQFYLSVKTHKIASHSVKCS